MEGAHQTVVFKPRIGANHDLSVMPSARDARQQLVDEALHAALRVGSAFAVADVDHLAGV